ncbi:hypothetical protein [Stenotrophomonas maltophilia]|uniref:Lipoprotein n=1 Tax=Stenotrophomonas maltophilia TaxID=40324 RepID=A0AAJ2JAT1_STEMA|nr:hypothetical protein [Stenotrophomonas maltophilia]MDT3468381.1 hypothetical protein [Stenotrophomonas maltophilia]
MIWRTSCVFVFCSFIGACALQPKSIPPQVSSAGYTSVSSTLLAGWIYLRSESYLPGSNLASAPPEIKVCESVTHSIQLEIYPGVEPDVERTRRNIDASATEAERWFPKRSIRYSVIVVPEGQSISVSRWSFGYRSAHLALAAPAFSNRERREGNLVDLVAHETFHILGRIDGDARGQDEYYAYYAGLCAQLAVLGSIPESALPGGPLQGGVDEPTRASSDSAYRVRREALLLSREGSIKAGGDGGSALALRCIALQTVTARPDYRGPNGS